MFKVEFYKDGDLVAVLPLHQRMDQENFVHKGVVEVRIGDFHLVLNASVLCTQVDKEG